MGLQSAACSGSNYYFSNFSKRLYFWTRNAHCRLLNVHLAIVGVTGLRWQQRLHNLHPALHHEEAPQKGKILVFGVHLHHFVEALVIFNEALADGRDRGCRKCVGDGDSDYSKF